MRWRRSAGEGAAWSKPVFAYCEPVSANPWSPNHIREVTDAGLKLGGGADTPALCGREMGWDLRVVPSDDDVMALSETFINEGRLVCQKCAQKMVDTEAA